VYDRSICLTVTPKGKTTMSKYRYEVKQLPGEILTDEKKTYFKVKSYKLTILNVCLCVNMYLLILLYMIAFELEGNNADCMLNASAVYL